MGERQGFGMIRPHLVVTDGARIEAANRAEAFRITKRLITEGKENIRVYNSSLDCIYKLGEKVEE